MQKVQLEDFLAACQFFIDTERVPTAGQLEERAGEEAEQRVTRQDQDLMESRLEYLAEARAEARAEAMLEMEGSPW